MKKHIAIAVLFLVVAVATSKNYFEEIVRPFAPVEVQKSIEQKVQRQKSQQENSAKEIPVVQKQVDVKPQSALKKLFEAQHSHRVGSCKECIVSDQLRAGSEWYYSMPDSCSGFEISPEMASQVIGSTEVREEMQALTSIDPIFENRPKTENLEEWLKVPYFLKFKLLPVSIANDDGSQPSPAYVYPEHLRAYMRQLFLDVEVLPTVQVNSTLARVPDAIYLVPNMIVHKIGDPGFDAFIDTLPSYGSNLIVAFYIGGSQEKGEGNGAYGWGGGRGVVIRNTYDFSTFSCLLLAHEVGHCFGLNHTETVDGLVAPEAIDENVMKANGFATDWRFERQRFDGFNQSQLERAWYDFIFYDEFTRDPILQQPRFYLSDGASGTRDALLIFPTIMGIDTVVQSTKDFGSWSGDHVCPSEWGAPIMMRWTETEDSKFYRLMR